MIADESDAREGAFELLKTMCPAGGDHEIHNYTLKSKDAQDLGWLNYRACRKCGLLDTYIRETPP